VFETTKKDLEFLKQALSDTTQEVESAIEEFQNNMGTILSDLRSSLSVIDNDDLNDAGQLMLNDIELMLDELDSNVDGVAWNFNYDFTEYDFEVDYVITKLVGLKLVWKVIDSTTELENIKTEIELLLRRNGVSLFDCNVSVLDENEVQL